MLAQCSYSMQLSREAFDLVLGLKLKLLTRSEALYWGYQKTENVHLILAGTYFVPAALHNICE